MISCISSVVLSGRGVLSPCLSKCQLNYICMLLFLMMIMVMAMMMMYVFLYRGLSTRRIWPSPWFTMFSSASVRVVCVFPLGLNSLVGFGFVVFENHVAFIRSSKGVKDCGARFTDNIWPGLLC